jgi:hypothetical protein
LFAGMRAVMPRMRAVGRGIDHQHPIGGRPYGCVRDAQPGLHRSQIRGPGHEKVAANDGAHVDSGHRCGGERGGSPGTHGRSA